MSASHVNNSAGPRQVTCETSDTDQIPVDLDVLRVAGTFKTMCDDLGLEEHEEFEGVFPVRTVSSRVFKKVVGWCKEHKGEPEPIVEKDPLTRECKWFTLTDSEKSFFDVPMLELLELVMAASFLDIPGLYHYACQSVADGIKGKCPREINVLLQQSCDLDDAHMRKALDDNPWLAWPCAFHNLPTKSAIFIPNEVLVTIFQKLPREDLERLQLVNSKFDGVIVSSAELSAHQGPLRVVTKIEFGLCPAGQKTDVWLRDVSCPAGQNTDVWIRDGTEAIRIACPDFKNLAKRLRFAIVQKLREAAVGNDERFYTDVRDFYRLLPVKSTWKNATVETALDCFPSAAVVKFVFTHLFLCKEVVLDAADLPSPWVHRPFARLRAIAACSKLELGDGGVRRFQTTDIIEWLEHEAPPEEKWIEPRELILYGDTLIDSIDDLLTALVTAFLTSDRRKPYVVRIRDYSDDYDDEVFENEETHERLSIKTDDNDEYFFILVERA